MEEPLQSFDINAECCFVAFSNSMPPLYVTSETFLFSRGSGSRVPMFLPALQPVIRTFTPFQQFPTTTVKALLAHSPVSHDFAGINFVTARCRVVPLVPFFSEVPPTWLMYRNFCYPPSSPSAWLQCTEFPTYICTYYICKIQCTVPIYIAMHYGIRPPSRSS